MGLWGIIFIVFLLFVLFIIISVALDGARNKAFDEQISQIPDFSSSIAYKGASCKNAVAIDIEREKIVTILNPLKIRSLETKPSVISFTDLLSVEVFRDDASVTKTNRGSQLAGAAVGGVLLGPAGLLLGGLSGSKRNEAKVKTLSLKLYTNDIVRPVQEIFFFDGGSVGIDASQLSSQLNDLDQWYGRFKAIIAKRA
jgi:hypothetical protein